MNAQVYLMVDLSMNVPTYTKDGDFPIHASGTIKFGFIKKKS
jgi:hypothetical protein